jgi:hypothetical protein
MLHANELLGPFSALNVGYLQSEWISLKLGETDKVHATTLKRAIVVKELPSIDSLRKTHIVTCIVISEDLSPYSSSSAN